MTDYIDVRLTPEEALMVDAAVYWFVHNRVLRGAADVNDLEIAELKLEVARMATRGFGGPEIKALGAKMGRLRDYAQSKLNEEGRGDAAFN